MRHGASHSTYKTLVITGKAKSDINSAGKRKENSKKQPREKKRQKRNIVNALSILKLIHEKRFWYGEWGPSFFGSFVLIQTFNTSALENVQAKRTSYGSDINSNNITTSSSEPVPQTQRITWSHQNCGPHGHGMVWLGMAGNWLVICLTYSTAPSSSIDVAEFLLKLLFPLNSK